MNNLLKIATQMLTYHKYVPCMLSRNAIKNKFKMLLTSTSDRLLFHRETFNLLELLVHGIRLYRKSANHEDAMCYKLSWILHILKSEKTIFSFLRFCWRQRMKEKSQKNSNPIYGCVVYLNRI